jgi:hypothetical protein
MAKSYYLAAQVSTSFSLLVFVSVNDGIDLQAAAIDSAARKPRPAQFWGWELAPAVLWPAGGFRIEFCTPAW